MTIEFFQNSLGIMHLYGIQNSLGVTHLYGIHEWFKIMHLYGIIEETPMDQWLNKDQLILLTTT